jgi:hypothetical protein
LDKLVDLGDEFLYAAESSAADGTSAPQTFLCDEYARRFAQDDDFVSGRRSGIGAQRHKKIEKVTAPPYEQNGASG